VIIPRGLDNKAAIDLLTTHLKRQLNDRGLPYMRTQLVSNFTDKSLPDSFKLIPMTNGLKALHTKIRNKDTPRDEFSFYAERLSSIVVQRYTHICY
jgi:uridine kinase